MTNVLEFRNVLMKKNRKAKNPIKKKKVEKATFWTEHFEERRVERKLSKKLIVACLEKGRVLEKDGAIHYVLDNFHVVVDRSDEESLLTAYFKTNFSEEQEVINVAA